MVGLEPKNSSPKYFSCSTSMCTGRFRGVVGLLRPRSGERHRFNNDTTHRYNKEAAAPGLAADHQTLHSPVRVGRTQ
jgi:hypothetical protein